MSARSVVRLGLIGAGSWGRNYIRTLSGMPAASLVRVASTNPATAGLVGPRCEVTTDWRAVAQASDLDGVIIATPAALHPEMTATAVEAGLPVLVEKPLAMDFEAARDLRQLVVERRGYVLVDHIYLYHPAYRALKERARQLGVIRSIRSCAGNHGPFRSDCPVLWDWGPHDVAMCLDLIGQAPASAAAAKAPRSGSPAGGETIEVALEFPQGTRASVRLSNLLQKRRRQFIVELEEGTLDWDDTREPRLALRSRREGGPEAGRTIPVGYEPPLTVLLETFIEAIASGRRDHAALDLAVEVTAVLARCQAALDSAQPGEN